ncbi:MAG: DinB family protein [Planctomycetota bacterium]
MSIFDHATALQGQVSERVMIAVRNMEFARRYTNSLLDDLSEDDWFFVPESGAGYVTHIAWQAGHLAMAQYGLTLFRQRGRNLEVDKQLMSSRFRKLFMRGTEPEADREKYPEPAEIREVMEKVHSRMLIEVAGFEDAELDEQTDQPHAAFDTRYGALLFAGDHEMVHAGQIGMLRRLMGKVPLR